MNALTQRLADVSVTIEPGGPAGLPKRVRAPVPRTLADAIDMLQEVTTRLDLALTGRDLLKAQNSHLMKELEAASRRAVAAQRVAHHDRLTGLPNRLFLTERLKKTIAAAGQRHLQMALLFIDLDGFKAVNDDHGHGVADRLLAVVASRIAACVRSDDIACRYGGDEFVVLLTHLGNTSVAAALLEKVRNHIAEDYTIAGHRIRITASIGRANFPEDGDQYDALMNHADADMYRDKAARRGLQTSA